MTGMIKAGASFTHQGSSYIVETRARMIIFDMAAFEADNVLLRRSSSFMCHPVDHPLRALSREHIGLMNWPDSFYKARQRQQQIQGDDRQISSLSARAMQLSRFGSMVSPPCLF